jgi:hypothetical protein
MLDKYRAGLSRRRLRGRNGVPPPWSGQNPSGPVRHFRSRDTRGPGNGRRFAVNGCSLSDRHWIEQLGA